MISLSHYGFDAATPYNGFGTGSQSEVAELNKALEAGYAVSSQTGGSALRVESLEGSLKVVTYNANHIKFWKKIPKSPAYSTVEEYNRLTSYGSDGGAFLREGELAPTTDSSYSRQTALVKFIGTVREVTHPMTVVHPAHGDVIALENQNGILWLLNKIEKALFSGDSSLAFDGESEEWDGLDAQIDASSYLDLEGQPLQEADIEEAANLLVENYAFPTDMFLGTRVASDLTKTFYPKERVNLPAPQNGMVGLSVSSVMTQAGVMELNPDVFLVKQPSPPSAATSSSAPTAPSTVAAAVDTGVTTGDFTKNAPAGTIYYGYAVTACNRFGESAPTYVSSNATMTEVNAEASRAIDVTITNPGSIGAFQPEYFRIYRTAAMTTNTVSTTASDYSLVAQVASSSVTGAGTTTWEDTNYQLPFTHTAYMGQLDPSVLTMRQLLPLMKLDLAVISPAYRWAIMMYATPILFATKKWLKIINIGQLT